MIRVGLLGVAVAAARQIPPCAVIAASATYLELELAPATPNGTLPGERRAHGCAFPVRLLRRRRVVSFFGGPVDAATGAALGAPPLGVHHLHVLDGGEDPIDFHFFATHGDFAGGKLPAWNTSLPAGFCRVSDGAPDRTNPYFYRCRR